MRDLQSSGGWGWSQPEFRVSRGNRVLTEGPWRGHRSRKGIVWQAASEGIRRLWGIKNYRFGARWARTTLGVPKRSEAKKDLRKSCELCWRSISVHSGELGFASAPLMAFWAMVGCWAMMGTSLSFCVLNLKRAMWKTVAAHTRSCFAVYRSELAIVIPFEPQPTESKEGKYYCPHFKAEQIEAQRG